MRDAGGRSDGANQNTGRKMFVQHGENKMSMKERGEKEETRGKPKRCHKSEGWRRDRQKEKILLERSAQSTSVKERH